jgi:hypothetical protein
MKNRTKRSAGAVENDDGIPPLCHKNYAIASRGKSAFSFPTRSVSRITLLLKKDILRKSIGSGEARYQEPGINEV